MQLVRVKSKNYRTLEDVEINFSKKYCTISGKNNAGKSALIRLILALFQNGTRYPWLDNENDLDYESDKTQWKKDKEAIVILYSVKLFRTDDAALISFIEKIAERKIDSNETLVEILYELGSDDKLKVAVTIDGYATDNKAAKDINAKIKASNLLFLYNSTTKQDYLMGRGRHLFYDYVLSSEDKKELDQAGKTIESKLKRLAREHKAGLNTILGRLSEKYDVEFSLPEGYATRRMPLGINLKDKHVAVPLDDWGSGTQNKTHILMAILQANRIKTTDSPSDRITPIVVIEEPESFLHPSAQSEFGTILCSLASELGIQVIVTTHSPYLLNRDEPASNILLCRKILRNKAFMTCQVETSDENWMAPFADHLGVDSKEFNNWKPLFSIFKNKVLLVEGEIDKEYFELFQSSNLNMVKLDKDIEVVPYGGKDTLKNTLLVKFVLSRFDKVFLTYDLDAELDCKKALERLGLCEGVDFLPIGEKKENKNDIEALLPNRVLSTVNAKETLLIRMLGSVKTDERRDAKGILKKKYLEEFKKNINYTEEELKYYSTVVKNINKSLK